MAARAEERVYVIDHGGVWHLLAEPGVREKTLCGRYPPIWPAPWPGRTENMELVSEDDVCRVCLRGAQRR